MSQSVEFDKYAAYRQSVQAPAIEARFIEHVYRDLRGSAPRVLREDYCGTFSICCEWVKLRTTSVAIGIDFDSEPLSYGTKNYLSKLDPSCRKRVQLVQDTVLNPNLPGADIICALNFSHYIHRDRATMQRYFEGCFRTLNKRGVMLIDCMGGRLAQKPHTESKVCRNLTYYWEQENFDSITHYADFHIHFKPKGRRAIKRAFTYNWRVWTIPELREIMRDAGFRRTHVYWEGTRSDGYGDGNFKRTETGEHCESWIAYIAAEK